MIERGLDYSFPGLRAYFSRNIVYPVNFNDGSLTDTIVLSGASVVVYDKRIARKTGVTASSSIITYWGLDLSPTTAFPRIDWDKKASVFFSIIRRASDAQNVTRVQLKAATAIGILAEAGVGLQIDNLALTGEAYGSSRGTVDLSTSLTAGVPAYIEIRHLPAERIEFLVNGISKGTITAAANIPSGAAASDLCFSTANGAAGTDTTSDLINVNILAGVA